MELYGPIWIVATLIIEFIVLGHLQTALSTKPVVSSKYTPDELLSIQANYSISKLFTVTFLMLIFFLINPFVCYLLFKNKGAMEITFISLL